MSATLKVLSDIYSAIDNGRITFLALLDVSAAFDTVDHDILMHRLSESFGIVGQAHNWLSSFVTRRTYSVRFGGTTTSPWKVRSGIPQGSILGPLLYILYTADVAALVESLGFKVHSYADETQLYDFCSSSEAEALAIRVNTAIKAVSSWMSSNRLCLNLDKTKYLWFGTRQQFGKRDTVALSNISAAMVSDTVTRNLGLLLDQELSMGDHITKLSQVCFSHLRRIRVVRHSLVHAFVCSWLDVCNIAMFGSTSICSIVYSRSLTLLLESSSRSISSAPSHRRSVMSCTGFLLDPGLSSNSASLSEAVWPAQLHPISLSFVSRSLRLLVVVKICARLPEVPLWYQGSRQNGGVSPFRTLTYGTRCRQEFALSSKSQISSRENLNII